MTKPPTLEDVENQMLQLSGQLEFLRREKTQVKKELCPICNFERDPTCRNGVIGLDPETRQPQTNPDGPTSSFIACARKLDWRDIWSPLPSFSPNETRLPKPKKPVSLVSDLVTEDKHPDNKFSNGSGQAPVL